MSINSCSINSSTINAICNNRRSAIIVSLLPAKPDGSRASLQKVDPYLRRLVDEDYDVDVSTLELPHIQVSVTMNGKTYSQTLERGDDHLPLINVSGIKIIDSGVETVNITDIKIRVL